LFAIVFHHQFLIAIFLKTIMPIKPGVEIKRIEDERFKTLAYDAMKCAFDVHNDFGRLFDEKIYQRELACRLKNACCEVPIEVSFEDFRKTYYLDLLIEGGVLFELKTVECLNDRHRGQLLNYLFLTGLSHGKLVNFRPERVGHEFVNNPVTTADRRSFEIAAGDWEEVETQSLKDRLIALLRDWGVGLELGLYEEAAAHICAHVENETDVEIRRHSHLLDVQRMRLAAPGLAIRFTALPPDAHGNYAVHLKRFIDHTDLKAIQWINITRRLVQFITIRKNHC
jgi:GxxExxY protein